MKSGNRNFLEPSGPLSACNGTTLPLLLLLLLLLRFAFAFIHCNLKFKFQKSLLINTGFIWADVFPEDGGIPSIQNVTALRIFPAYHPPFHWSRNARNGICVPILFTKGSGFTSVASNLPSYFVTKFKTLLILVKLNFYSLIKKIVLAFCRYPFRVPAGFPFILTEDAEIIVCLCGIIFRAMLFVDKQRPSESLFILTTSRFTVYPASYEIVTCRFLCNNNNNLLTLRHIVPNETEWSSEVFQWYTSLRSIQGVTGGTDQTSGGCSLC